ncbi:MAG: VWA domain-containing protein [Polyangiaceae bacterium]|nr:VWA domain-containing protein [Polyangiaceae bacterium]
MGFGDYSHEAHVALVTQRAAKGAEVFVQDACHPLMNPKGVRARESRDSPDHPRSLGVVFALDVSGSMGEIPRLLASRELPSFMKVLESCKVPDPQVLFAAIGNAGWDRAPLQVGQFESTADLMDRWLTSIYLEGGGGNEYESYELALYFFATHTEMDCWVKRKHRGYLFVTGDEPPWPALPKEHVEAVLGERLDADVPTLEVVAELRRTFHPFFLIPDPGRRGCERVWRDLLGDAVICMETPEDTCYVAGGAVALGEGVARDLDALARLLEAAGATRERTARVVRTLGPYAASLDRDGAPPPPAR